MQRQILLGKSILIFCLFLVMQTSYASALGLPANTARVGYGMGTSYATFDDPVASSNKSWSQTPIQVIYTDWFIGGSRYWADINLSETIIDSGGSKTHQIVRSYGARLSIQNTLYAMQGWSPWIGAGVELNRVNYSKRHTTDEDGYLLQRFPNAHENNIGLIVNLMGEGMITRKISLGGRIEQFYAVTNTNHSFTMNIVALYRF